MATFKTSDGREYVLRLDAVKIQAVRNELDLDLAALNFDIAFQKLSQDPVLLVNVLWVLVRDKADVTTQAFGESLVGDSIDEAAHALIQARADFSPSRMRKVILQAAETSNRIRDKSAAMAMERLSDPAIEERILKATEAKMKAELEECLTRFESAGNLPEPAESQPED